MEKLWPGFPHKFLGISVHLGENIDKLITSGSSKYLFVRIIEPKNGLVCKDPQSSSTATSPSSPGRLLN